jgi:hypothetical protein
MTSYYAGLTMNTPIKQLKVGAAYDYAALHDNSFGPTGYAQTLGLYASFQATEKLSLHGRGEWLDVTDGVAGAGGVASEAIALTGTIQYDLWANVLSRLEVRWDTAIDGPNAYGGTAPSGSGKKSEVLVAGNFIYKF